MKNKRKKVIVIIKLISIPIGILLGYILARTYGTSAIEIGNMNSIMMCIGIMIILMVIYPTGILISALHDIQNINQDTQTKRFADQISKKGNVRKIVKLKAKSNLTREILDATISSLILKELNDNEYEIQVKLKDEQLITRKIKLNEMTDYFV